MVLVDTRQAGRWGMHGLYISLYSVSLTKTRPVLVQQLTNKHVSTNNYVSQQSTKVSAIALADCILS